MHDRPAEHFADHLAADPLDGHGPAIRRHHGLPDRQRLHRHLAQGRPDQGAFDKAGILGDRRSGEVVVILDAVQQGRVEDVEIIVEQDQEAIRTARTR